MNATQTASTLNKNTNCPVDPWAHPARRSFDDLIFKDEYQSRRLDLPQGSTWMRIIPHKTGKHPWMLPIHAIKSDHFQFVHPRTFGSKTNCVFDDAYTWFKKHRPQDLYSKTNRNGIRLLCDRMVAFWVAVQGEDKAVARLFLHNGYGGNRGGAAGLGFRVLQLTLDKDEKGQPMQDIVDAELGVQIGIEKTKPLGAQFPRYDLHVGRTACPLDKILARMEAEELRALCPIEDTVRELTREEQWPLLAKMVGADIANRIHESLNQ